MPDPLYPMIARISKRGADSYAHLHSGPSRVGNERVDISQANFRNQSSMLGEYVEMLSPDLKNHLTHTLEI
jgi:hypothetical protein